MNKMKEAPVASQKNVSPAATLSFDVEIISLLPLSFDEIFI